MEGEGWKIEEERQKVGEYSSYVVTIIVILIVVACVCLCVCLYQ